MSTVNTKTINDRKEQRRTTQLFFRLNGVGEGSDYNAVARATDISKSGIGLIVFRSIPVGTHVEIKLYGETVAIGEIVDLNEDFDDWDWSGLDRMGVRIIEKKSGWPM